MSAETEVLDFSTWNLPIHHTEKIKEIHDEVSMDYLKTGLSKFLYSNTFKDEKYTNAISDLLTQEYGDEVRTSELFATYGATFGFTVLMTTFFEAGDPAIFEDVTCGCNADFAKLYGVNLMSVEHTDDDDLDLVALEEKMKGAVSKRQVTPNKPWKGFVYLLSVLHNPKGTSISEDCSRKAVELARKYNFLLIGDDVYNFYNFTTQPMRRILYYDKISRDESGPGNALSIGTLSKFVFPSIRVGWVEASKCVIDLLFKRPDLALCGGYNMFNQGLGARILLHPRFKPFLKDIREFYKNLQDEAYTLMIKNLPSSVKIRKPDGSFFFWVKLPEHCGSLNLVEAFEKKNILICDGPRYSFNREGYKNYIRVAYSNIHHNQMNDGLMRLCVAIKEIIG